jgi:hypothetical protein
MGDFKLVKLVDAPVSIDLGITPRGAYDAGTAYVIGDLVSYNNSAYIAIASTTGNLPTNTTYWMLVAQGFSSEDVMDTVGNILTDSASIDFTYNDGTDQITAAVIPGGVNHASLANLTVGDPHTQYLLAAGDTITGAMTWALSGTHNVLSGDSTVFRDFDADNMTAGALNSLVGEPIMYGWIHNSAVNPSGGGGTTYSLASRDVSGQYCQMGVITQSGKLRYYYSTDTTGAPSFTEKFAIDLATGHVTTYGIRPVAGSATAGSAPVKFTSGTLNTVAEAGALEYLEGRLYLTGTNAADRMVLSQSEDVITSSTTVANTATETTLHTFTVTANELASGRAFNACLMGQYSKADVAHTLTVRLKVGGSTVATFTAPSSAATEMPIELIVNGTCRSIGVSGTVMLFSKCTLSGTTAYYTPTAATTLDTTANISVEVTAQWGTAAVGSTISADQTYLDWRN